MAAVGRLVVNFLNLLFISREIIYFTYLSMCLIHPSHISP